MPTRVPDQTYAALRTCAEDRIPVVSRTGALRPSPGQERLWFLDGPHGSGTNY